jgi:hypothetical protein
MTKKYSSMCPCLGVTLFHPGCRILHADVMKNLKQKKINISPFQISFPHPHQKASFLPVKLHSDIFHRPPLQITCTAASYKKGFLPIKLHSDLFHIFHLQPPFQNTCTAALSKNKCSYRFHTLI